MSDEIAEPINELVGARFYALTFLATYLQLQFEGPQMGEYHHFHADIPPRIRADGKWFEWGEPGYRDAICDQFGAKVRTAETDIEGEQIVIEFESGALITVSLRAEDLRGMEAADYSHTGGRGLKDRSGSLWTPTWKDDWKRLYITR
jgi:hypothetical protein